MVNVLGVLVVVSIVGLGIVNIGKVVHGRDKMKCKDDCPKFLKFEITLFIMTFFGFGMGILLMLILNM